MFQIKASWSEFKSFIAERSVEVQYHQTGNNYMVASQDGYFLMVSNITGADAAEFESDYKSLANKQIEYRSKIQKAISVITKKPDGVSSTKVSHDWTDKTTWYQKSTEVTGESITAEVDGVTFKGAHTHWIDLTHGKVYSEYSLADKKEPKVYLDSVEVTTGFSINYDSGEVVFDTAPTGALTVDYWYAGSSCWTLAPDPGKMLIIEHVELNFSSDIKISSPVNFEIWVYNPADLPNKVPYQVVKYKNMKDIINGANLGQGYIPKCGDLANDVLVFPFNYATVKPVQSAYGAELRVSVDGDIPLTGEWSTCAMYVLIEDDV